MTISNNLASMAMSISIQNMILALVGNRDEPIPTAMIADILEGFRQIATKL